MGDSNALSQYFQDSVSEFLEEKFRKNVKFDIVNGASKADSFISDIYKIKVFNNDRDKNTDNNVFTETKKAETYNFILKIIRSTRVSKEVPFISNSFIRETAVYDELFKEYELLEREYGLKENEKFRHVEVFKYSSIEGKEFILMEDLNKLGFEMFDRYSPLDEKHVNLIIKDLAKVHALSFALKTHKPDVFFELVPKLIVNEITQIQTYIMLANKKSIDILDKDEDKIKLADYLKSFAEKQSHINMSFDEKLKNPYYVLCHGDCWINNFMFKYGVDRKIPADVRVLDWQVMEYSSPIRDIIHLIFLTTDGAFRKENYTKVINKYYQELGNNLSKFKLCVDDVYPKDKFESDCILFLSHGLGVAIGALPFVLCEKDSKLNLDDVYGDVIDDSKVIYTELIVRRLREVLTDILNMI